MRLPLASGRYRTSQSWTTFRLKRICCADCVADNDGYGKFEAYSNDRHSLAIALILYAWSLDSGEDDSTSCEGWGWLGRFGRFLLIEDTRGFVTFEDYGTYDKAGKAFDDYYDGGWGASEDDAYIGEGGDVFFAGKRVNVYANRNGEISDRRRRAAVRLEAARQGFYPNLWQDNGRGNLSRVDY
jgi:hypothetical protein